MDNLREHLSKSFTCPHCQVLAQQKWFNSGFASKITIGIMNQFYLEYRADIQVYEQTAISDFIGKIDFVYHKNLYEYFPSGFSVSNCQFCKEVSLWVGNKMVYPRHTQIAPPNEDMDSDIKELYLEASVIFNDSAKGSTALLRLALQKLLKQLGKQGKNINQDIKDLVDDGLSPKIQKALDLVRVVGNNAVHPGQIDLEDDSNIALKLFGLLNFIANELITRPNELDDLYEETIPDNTKDHIKQRDGVS